MFRYLIVLLYHSGRWNNRTYLPFPRLFWNKEISPYNQKLPVKPKLIDFKTFDIVT